MGQLKSRWCDGWRGSSSGPGTTNTSSVRCRIGRVHVRIGLPQHYMFGAMDVLRLETLHVVDEMRTLDRKTSWDARAAVNRILDLELAIMLHTYREDLEAQRMAAVGTLTAGLSHEIRNPLNAAGLQLAVLERRLRRLPAPEQTAALKPLILVRDEIRRLDHLLEDLLQYARPRQLERQPVDMATLVQRVAQLLVSDADSRGVTIARSVEPNLAASGDEARLREVVMNLVLNALDASERGSEVRIKGRRLGPVEIELSVEDDGPGWPLSSGSRSSSRSSPPRRRGRGWGWRSFTPS